MARIPPINRRPFDNTAIPSPPPRGEVGKSQSDFPGGGRTRAQQLRVNATPAEHLLWLSLRTLKPLGFHFRRQAPMRHYILDFVCHSAKLVIELDGSQHGDPKMAIYDARRTAFLQSQSYRVLRFWNGDVLRNLEGVTSMILRALEAPTRNAPHSDLPTRGR